MKDEILSKIGDAQTCPVAIMIREGKLLSGHRHYTKDKWKDISVWTVPGGRCDASEKIEETLRREVFEEVGIDDFTVDAYIGEAPGAKEGDKVPMFLCNTTQDAQLMEPEKFSEWRWITIDEYIKGDYAQGKFINPKAREMIIDFFNKN